MRRCKSSNSKLVSFVCFHLYRGSRFEHYSRSYPDLIVWAG